MNIETKPYKYNEFKQFLRFELGMSDNSVISDDNELWDYDCYCSDFSVGLYYE